MIAALLLLSAPVDLAPGAPKPVQTTVAAIRADPKRFDGVVVRLHGYVNSCQPNCTIEDGRRASGTAATGIVIGLNDQFDKIVAPLVPTYLELDARFSAGCDAGAVCLGPYPRLQIVSLRGVVSPEPPEIEK